MKLTRVENRCNHGFLVGLGLCPDCEGGHAIRDESRVHRKEVVVPGANIGGSTVTRKLGGEEVEMRCGCGETYFTTRNALLQARSRGRRSCCAACRSLKLTKEAS